MCRHVRLELELLAAIGRPHPGKAEHRRLPQPRQGRLVYALGGIVRTQRHIQLRGTPPERIRRIGPPQPRSHQGVYRRGKRGIVRRQRQIVIERHFHLAFRELGREQRHHHQHVGLLQGPRPVQPFLRDEHAEGLGAVGPEAVELGHGKGLECFRLQIQLPPLVVRDGQRIGNRREQLDLAIAQGELFAELAVHLRVLALQIVPQPDGTLQDELGSAIGVSVVVGEVAVLVRAHDAQDAVVLLAGPAIDAMRPETGHLEGNLRPRLQFRLGLDSRHTQHCPAPATRRS